MMSAKNGARTGIIRFLAKPGSVVKAGQPIAKIVNAFGRHQATMAAIGEAIVLGHSDSSAAFPGMPVMAFGIPGGKIPEAEKAHESLLKSMRDRSFVAAHRGGPLKKEQHYQLIKWACDCAEHVLNLSGEKIDERIISALKIAEEWRKGKTSVGEARKASLGAIAAANGSANPVAIAAARSIGHAVATAHMADHSLAAADYALKAVKNAGQSVETERKWQDVKLPPEVRGLVLSARKKRKAQ